MNTQIKAKEPSVGSSSKVNRICDALKQELASLNQKNGNNGYLLPILTLHVKKQPQEIEEVLSMIRDMQKHEKAENLTVRVVPPHLNPETMRRDIDPDAQKTGSKEALEYVSWLVNANRLFDVALTTYDFDLVTLVAT
jgi:elongator complex protein 1